MYQKHGQFIERGHRAQLRFSNVAPITCNQHVHCDIPISHHHRPKHICEPLITQQTLDLQHNRINDLNVVDIVSAMHDLRVLYLQGNPVVKHIRHYRRMLVSKCLALKYLDDRYEANHKGMPFLLRLTIDHHAIKFCGERVGYVRTRRPAELTHNRVLASCLQTCISRGAP